MSSSVPCRSDPATSLPSSWARALTGRWCRPGTPPPRRRWPSRRSPPSSTRPTARCSQYSTVQYSTVQYSTIQYSTVQYSTWCLATMPRLASSVLASRWGTRPGTLAGHEEGSLMDTATWTFVKSLLVNIPYGQSSAKLPVILSHSHLVI